MTRKHFNWFANWLATNDEISPKMLEELSNWFETQNDNYDSTRFWKEVERLRNG